MSDPKEIDYGQPFILHVKIEVKNGLQSKLLTDFLNENDFKYDDERHMDMYYHTYILCDSLTDAARIETFIQSPK